ncbi:MAG: hypothetical protein ACOYUZ_02600 [Patescibacteria group bacterium]
MPYEQIKDLFFAERNHGTLFFSSAADNLPLLAVLMEFGLTDLTDQKLSDQELLILASGKHPFLIIRCQWPIEKDTDAGDIFQEIRNSPQDKSYDYDYWFFLIPSNEFPRVMARIKHVFGGRDGITEAKDRPRIFIFDMKKDELLTYALFSQFPFTGNFASIFKAG